MRDAKRRREGERQTDRQTDRPTDTHTHTQDPAHASSVTSVEVVPDHGLPQHNAARYTLNIDVPMQRVMKLRKLPPFSLPPREDTDLETISTELLRPHIPKWDCLLAANAP